MARGNRGAGGLVSFAAGFGNGYLAGEKQKEDKKRQDELDKIRMEENERARADFEEKQEARRKEKRLNEELAANSKPEYKNKTNIAAEGLTMALPKVFSGDDAESRNSQYVKYPNNKNYTTSLSAEDESKFNSWVKDNNVPFDPSEKADYDMRGYWKDVASQGQNGTQVNANDGQMHFPDTYKTPYHQSFSNESKYASADAPAWNEKDQLVAKDGKVAFDEKNPAAQGLTSLDKAKHFMANSTPEQQERFSNFYAQQGLSATGNEVFTKGSNGGLAVADKTQTQAKPMWQTMQDRAMTYLTSENSKPEYQSQAFQMIKQATEMKSEEYMQKIVEARKGGLPALLALANGHSNDELPYTDLKVEPTSDGKARLAGVDSSTGKPFEKVYDLKDGSIEDQITQDLSNLASPTMMLNGIARKIETARLNREESRKDKLTDGQLRKLDQDIQEGKIKLESLPESIKLDLQGKRANINQSNAATEASIANTEKTREETNIVKSGAGNDKLPTSVREAMWYKSATPEQQAIFDQMNDKSAKVTSDGVGGFMINNKSGMFRMDDAGKVTKVEGLDGKGKPQPAKKPTYNDLWR